MKKHALLSSVLLLAASFISFIRPVSADVPRTEPIIDGTPVNADEYPYVGRIELDGDVLCTGTLVAPRYVLTAAHCFYGDDGRRSVGNTAVSVRFGRNTRIGSANVAIHPTYRSRDSACIEGEVDAAVITLKQDATGITPIPMMSSSVAAGSTVFLAGYGTQGDGASGEDGTTPPVGTINVGNASVDGFGEDPPTSNPNSLYFFWNFISGESNTASGDSGGPAFQDVGGQRHLAGITCGGYGNAEYGTYSLDTRVDKIKAWVDSHIGNQPSGNRWVNIKAVELNYDNSRNDYLYIRGQLDVGTGFKPRGKLVTIKIGNYTRQFRLDADGEAGNSKSYFGLTGAFRGAAFRNSTVKYEIELIKLPVFREFAGFGFPVSANASANQEAVIPLSIIVDGTESSASSVLVYKPRGRVWKVKPGQ